MFTTQRGHHVVRSVPPVNRNHLTPTNNRTNHQPTKLTTHPYIQYPNWQSAFSEAALRQAWLAVKANKGGAFRETLADFANDLDRQLSRIRKEVLSGSFKPKRVTQMLIPKASGSWRPITLWSIRDRVAQRAVYNYLEPLWDKHFAACSYGFRGGLSTRDAAEAVQQAYAANQRWVLDADIKDCFGSIDSARLLKLLQRWRVPQPLQAIIEKWLKARIFNAWRDSKLAGTSQGSVLSPLLCNLYLHSFDCAVANRGWRLVRYADDFVVMGHSQQSIVSAKRHVLHTLQRLSLKLHQQKTRTVHFDDGFQFVGWFFVRDEVYQLK